jgi:hypothetical protein
MKFLILPGKTGEKVEFTFSFKHKLWKGAANGKYFIRQYSGADD